MAKTFSVLEVEAILASGRFNNLLGGVEHGHLECKAAPYQLDQDRQKMELAKDVSALANADGGVLLIGVQTERNPVHLGDEIRHIGAFPAALLDTGQYLKVLGEWVYPAIRGMTIQWHSIAGDEHNGIVCIKVPPNASQNRPYLVGKIVEPTGKIVGSHFGYFERVQSDAKPMSFEELRERLKDGFRFFELDARIRGIEATLGTLVGHASQKAAAISERTVFERIANARQTAQLQERPTFYLAAWPSEPIEFSTLFESRTTPVVQLLDNPPRLRSMGFDMNTDRLSEIVQGELRRSVNIRPKLLELWRDGVLIFVAPGDEWYLCWGMGSTAATGLVINNLSLTEMTYLFCNLAIKLFEYPVPQPSKLNLYVGLSSMTTVGGLCRLSSSRLSRYFPDKGNAAPADRVALMHEVERGSVDAGTVSYSLLAKIYAWFGFEEDQMQYVNREGLTPTIDPSQIMSQTG